MINATMTKLSLTLPTYGIQGHLSSVINTYLLSHINNNIEE